MTDASIIYFGYAKNALTGKYDVAPFRRIKGALVRGDVVFSYDTDEAAYLHCWMRNSVTAVTQS